VVAGLNGSQQCVTDMLDQYRIRRDKLCTWLAEEPRIRLVKPAGAFYLFPDVSDFLSPDGVRTSAELAQSLLDGPRVAVTPGEAFDAPGCLRISYAASIEDLERGAQKIIAHLRSIESRTTV
jgi:aspartate aminotransferase